MGIELESHYIVKVVGGSSHTETPTTLRFKAESVEGFKTAFLKRWGNVGGVNKAEQERPKLKQAVKQAKTIDEIEELFLHSNHWHLAIYGNPQVCYTEGE